VQGGAVSEASRAVLAFTAPLPTQLAVRREIADVWIKAGAIGQAMGELEALQLWEPLVTCYLISGLPQIESMQVFDDHRDATGKMVSPGTVDTCYSDDA
jgi:hypothetical protein